MKKIFASLIALALGLGLGLAAAAPAGAVPTGNTNAVTYWQTPGTGEICVKIEPGGKTWSLGSVTLPAGTQATKVIVKAGSASSVGAENNAYYQNATYKYPDPEATATWIQVASLAGATFSAPEAKDISHVIYCYAPAQSTPVGGAAVASPQACISNVLTDGYITVTVTTGVTYVIKNSSNVVIPFNAGTGATAGIPTGNYTVEVSAQTGYTLTSPSSVPLTVAPAGGQCGVVSTPVSGAAAATDELCTRDQLLDGYITVTVTPGVSYVIKNSSNVVIPFNAGSGMTAALPSGNYSVEVAAEAGFTLTGPASIPLTIDPYTDPCGQISTPVAGQAVPTDQTCDIDYVDGYITVTVKPGVTYVIKNSSNAVIPFNAGTGETAALPTGNYTVEVSAQTGYTLTSSASIPLTIAPYTLACGQNTTNPLTTATATSVDAGCDVAGSYTLSSEQGPGDVIWKANGVVIAAGPHSLPAGTSVTITVEPATGFGFPFDQRTSWPFSSGESTVCGDLTTLALTGGSNTTPYLFAAGLLGLLGVAMVRSARRQKA